MIEPTTIDKQLASLVCSARKQWHAFLRNRKASVAIGDHYDRRAEVFHARATANMRAVRLITRPDTGYPSLPFYRPVVGDI